MRNSRLIVSLATSVAILALGLVAFAWALGAGSSEAQQDAMQNCPQAGKWAISAWSGQDATESGQALDTCGSAAVAAAYWIDPQTQAWSRYFDGRPEISNLLSLDHMQGMLTLGAGGTLPSTARIAFGSDRDGDHEIYVMNADGSAQTKLTNNTDEDSEPTWSPDGSKIAFVSRRDGNGEIYVMNADGTGQTNLSNNTDEDSEPTWSPDGSKIAFVSRRDGNDEIYVMNADGTGPTRLTNNTASDYDLVWSPDGSKIAFVSNRDGSRQVYVMNADGTGQTNLTNSSGHDFSPAWSSDGSKIAFLSNRDGNAEIYVMNADGSGQTKLTNNPAADSGPVWSPDGTQIAFISDRDMDQWASGDVFGFAPEIYVMNADGSGQVNLTNNPAADDEPAWSPDGAQIAFASHRNANDEIYVVNGDGSGLTNLTNNPANDGSPDWSPLGVVSAAVHPPRSLLGLDSAQTQQDAMQNCPQAGKWAISVWSGDDGTPAEQAFATCGEGALAAAYYIDAESQGWSRWFSGRPQLSTLDTLDDMQGVVALGSVSPAPPTATPTPTATPLPMSGVTWYVRPDGASPAQCTGTVDAPYPGSGSGQPCAWDHPFRALPPGGPPRIAGGDTLVIGSGSYVMGYGAPEADQEDDFCASDYPWSCNMAPVPSGPDPEHPTRILGAGWDAGCPSPPELWGTERADQILDLTDSSNVEVACLEITDHSGCVEDHTGGLACERDTFPFGDWAARGIYAEDSANVHLRNLNIHGLAASGVHAGRLTDWTVEDVRIAGNGLVGWDGDLWEGEDSNSGTLLFRRWTVEWNGCGETYPGGEPTGCWAQTAGGYGDGVGTGATGGDWIIEDSAFLHNTSDGLDLLYHELGGSITLNRVRAEGNAGNQIKTTGQATITNSVLVGNCAFFEGKSFTYNVDPCRAEGVTLTVYYTGGEQVSIVNSTFYGQGDGLVGGGPREGFQCNGSEALTGRNNIFLGDQDFFDPGDITFLFYTEGCSDLMFEGDYSIAHNVKNVDAPYVSPPYPSAHNLLEDPGLSGPFSGDAYGMTLASGSPAIDAGTTGGAPPDDFDGLPRDSKPDIGAYERRASNSGS